MSDPGADSGAVPTGPQPQQARPMDPERKKKLLLLGVAGAAVLILVVVGNLAAKKRREAAASAPPPVTISNAEAKPAADMLPLVSIGGQGKGGASGMGPSEQELELEGLTRELKLLQARTAVVQARQNLADLRVTPKAQEQRSLALEFAKKGDPKRQGMDSESPALANPQGQVMAQKSPSFAEVAVSKPSDSPLTFVLRMGTLLDAVLVNKLVSDNYTSPVMAMVDRPYYDPLTRKLLVPAGTRILGKAEAVKFQTASRLAITFDTFQFPNGTTFTVKPDEQALEGLGIFGLQDSVNRHTARILFTAGLVGVLTGWNASQVQSGGAYGAYDGADMMRIQANNSMSKTGEQLLSPFLNAVPTITVNEGHRLKVWISRDIPMDAYLEAPNE
ncbi:MAG: TrbI/VirB10 family protein [Acidobacteriota bacterium]